MSLNWSITEVEGWEALQNDAEAWRMTDSLIWYTLVVGINHITEDNYKEFYARVHMLELLEGHSIARYISLPSIKRRIGLKTNASTLTRLQFVRRHVTRKLDQLAEVGR